MLYTTAVRSARLPDLPAVPFCAHYLISYHKSGQHCVTSRNHAMIRA